jgi:hypothetical protein
MKDSNRMVASISQIQSILNFFSRMQLSFEAARSKALTVFSRSNTGIAGSNPTRDMDVCLRFSALCCPV